MDSMTESAPAPVGAAEEAPPSADVPAIALEGVAKTFRTGREEVAAVARTDLEIAQGEFFSLLGPSGCGKTTTMRMVAGFEDPTEGTVRLKGADVTRVAPDRRDVNMVFQSYALFPHMTVFDNIAFGLRRKGVPRDEVRRRVGEMLELVELSGRGRTKPGRMSGGQQQRVALARALVNRPSALLLDEPLGALDLKLRQAMQIELKRIQRDVGITFVYVTHDQGEALTMSDRIAVMNKGAVEQLGPPREIYERPASRFVAGFIGTSNLLSGTVSDASGGLAAFPAGEEGTVRAATGAAVGETVEITVRPEKIALHTARPDGAGTRSRVPGTVSEVVYLGSATHYTVAVDTGAQGGTELTVYTQNSAGTDDGPARGDRVWLEWGPEHSYVLPA
ncbi:ABC transporter ATP-binding protein [Nocardiopsis halophila]|uniref:ABC transporter ATP-binding protein n=1 Tax=Nocardiopsis halophila TaxID=141692 RepID=UPI00034C1F77|nr:ABC transporter ATP-binding protein [Nocardiopsis halophila]